SFSVSCREHRHQLCAKEEHLPMPVPVIRFERRGRIRWGVVRNDKVFAMQGEYATTEEFIRAVVGNEELLALGTDAIPRSEVTVLSPVTRNQQFICLGANYRQHMIESGIDPDTKHYNMMFTKAPGCIVPADTEVIKPRCVRFLDYEIEVGLVIKNDVQHKVIVSEENLSDYVAGVVIVNDYSARDINGPAETLTELSGIHDLAPGDLIATGTPSGCALSVPSPFKQRIFALLPEATKWRTFLKVQERRTQYLKVGEVVESRIRSSDGVVDLGVQRNVVVEEA